MPGVELNCQQEQTGRLSSLGNDTLDLFLVKTVWKKIRSVRLHLCAIFGVKYTDFPARLQELGLSPQAIAQVARRFVNEEELVECFRSAPHLFDINIPQAAELCKLLVPDALALRRWEHYERMVSKFRRKDLTKKVAKEICRAFPDALPPKTQLHKFLKGKLAPAIVARLYEND
eukprot:GEMP01057230.1.p1 GENE.GEMP01057230.1~~GEMP01057230.1.p1  ORF type:complete len:174 (+),score=23.15 GEMP01057230.1:106-627(+)